MAIGEVVRAARKARGLSQGQLAELLGLNGTAISKIERGERGADVSTINGLIRELGLDASDTIAAFAALIPNRDGPAEVAQ